MFKIYLNDECFYDDRMEQRSITGLKLTLEENKAGSLEFTIYPDHPYYSAFEKITSTILVKQNDVIIFRGRVLDSEESFYKDRKITCEGEYAFFNDGIFYPLGQDGGEDEYGEEQITPFTPIEIFTQIITDYNSQVSEDRRFLIGNISITGSTEEIGYANMEFIKSIEALDDLIDRCGGHFIFRHEDEGVYIDWTEDYESINQNVSFGINLLDLTQTIQGDKVVTAILPHGDTREDTNWPCNISTLQIPTTTLHRQMGVVPDSESRNEQFGDYGIYLVNIPLYEKYGLIIEERSYDGYPDDWKDQLIADVYNLTGLSNSIEITAVDMSCLNDVDFFQIGKKVDVISDKHGIKDSYNITKLELNLQNPSSNKFTLGKVIPNFVEQIVNDNKTKPVDGKSIKITGYEFAYAISESGTEKPDDESFSTTYSPQQGKWLWTRVTTKFNDGTETKCYYPSYQGMDAKQFRIKADSTVVIRNDRRTDAQTIIFTAEISGYPNAVPLWYIDGEKVGEGGSYSRSIPYKGAEKFSISLYDNTTLMDTLNLSILDETKKDVYLGECTTSTPTQVIDEDGSTLALCKGDYFLCSKTFDNFIAGNPYVYDGETWIVADIDGFITLDKYSDIMSHCLTDALSGDTDTNTKFMSWFQNLASKKAFLQYLGAQYIRLINGGKIYGGAYTMDSEGNISNPTGGLGFCLSDDGRFEAVEALLKKLTVEGLNATKAYIEGELTCEDEKGTVFKTQKGSSVTKEIPCSTADHWNSTDAFSVPYGSSGDASFGGSSYKYKRTNDANMLEIHRKEVRDGTGWWPTISLDTTDSYTGKYKLRITCYTDIDNTSRITIKVNNKTIVNWEEIDWQDIKDGGHLEYNFTANKGDSIHYDYDHPTMLGIGLWSVTSLYFYDENTIPLYNSSNPLSGVEIRKDVIYPHSTKLTLGNVFNSDNYVRYALPDGWANGLPAVNVTYICEATTCVINGISRQIANVRKTNTEVVVYTAEIGYVTLKMGSYYYISGTLKLVDSERGNITETLIPSNDNSAIGTPNKPFKNGYINNMQGNVNSEGTNYKVWGAVAN